MNTRRLFWLAFLGGAVALAVIPELFFAEPEHALAMTPANSPLSQPSQGSLAELRSAETLKVAEGPPATRAAVPHADLFAPHSWYVAPPAPAMQALLPRVAVAPPAPVAPPLPFRFIGKLNDRQQLQVFLLKGEQLYTVRVGDVIDDTYRVEEIEQARMLLTYLPLRISQSLAVGGDL